MALRQTPRAALGVKQGQRQSLVMTPQLTQAIRLLSMSNLELSDYVDGELERNPLLELDGAPRLTDTEVVTTETRNIDDTIPVSTGALAAELGTDVANQWPEQRPVPRPLSGLPSQATEGDDPMAREAARPCLADHLRGQLALLPLPRMTAAIASHIIASLAPTGYWHDDADDLPARLGCTLEDVTAGLAAVQQLEPIGVGARGLAECLALQLRAKDRLDPAMQTLLANLDLLAKRDFATLRRLTGMDDGDLIDALADIRACDPKPGTAFDANPVQTISADVHVTEAPDGSWSIRLDDDTLPRVLIDNVYARSLEKQAVGREEAAVKEFTQTCLADATWLARSLDQRAKTILDVVTEIVKQQDAFLVHGVRHLRPLTLQQVADAIGMHESTISRVTSNKYVSTPRGLFSLKYFFTTTIQAMGGGETHSSESVRDRIRALIAAETAESVLSDDAIVTVLRAEEIDIARRTVAKYREGMGFPSSVRRKRELRAAAKAAALAA